MNALVTRPQKIHERIRKSHEILLERRKKDVVLAKYAKEYSDGAGAVHAQIATACLTCTEISTVHLHTKTRIEDLRHRNALIRVLVYRAFVSSYPRFPYLD